MGDLLVMGDLLLLDSVTNAIVPNMGSISKTRRLDCGALLMVAMVVALALCNMGAVDAVKAIYVFGDSYVDTGNNPVTVQPYGSDWPGHTASRWSDGRVLTDYFAQLFGLPTPTPYLQLTNDSAPLQGINFARSGGGITYAWGVPDLDSQVDEMEALVYNGVLTQDHLRQSVTVMNIGVNDYYVRNSQVPFQESHFGVHELKTFVHTVVNGIALNLERLHSFGVRNIVVLNLPLMECLPLSTMDATLGFRACSTNTTFVNETSLHNSLLQQRVKGLNEQLKGFHVVIADQTKAFHELFYHGSNYGFENSLTPCCHGNSNSTLYSLECGHEDSEGKPLYTLCQDPSKAVLYDAIHPSQAASKVMVDLFASVPGFTLEGPMLNTWIRKYNI